jgi:DeoR/GlpR family transcriptional regulator of sugar metabolism
MYYITVNEHPSGRAAMSLLERHNQIVDTVLRVGRITIPEICELFDVSEMTARRDLNELDRLGLVRRVHGGAIASLGRSYEPPFQTRSAQNQAAKEAIGRAAAELIYDGDSIALDVGTTTLEIVKNLKDKHNLTIVTSCLPIANLVITTLSIENDLRLILTGGIVRPREHSLVGSLAERVYAEYHVDKAFIGIGGISLEDGLTEYNIDDTEMKKALLRSAREKIIVADSSKFNVTTFASVGPLNGVDKIVTDPGVPPEMAAAFRRLGVELIIAA